MRAFSVLFARLRGLFGRPDDVEFDAEMREHLHLLTAQYVERGLLPEDAASAARRQFGNTTVLQEQRRLLQTVPALECLWRDARYAARSLRKTPTFTIVATLTLALGIGANVLIFTIVNPILLRPLPYRDSERLVTMLRTNLLRGDAPLGVSPSDYEAWRRQSRSFDELAAVRGVGGVGVMSGTGLAPQMVNVAGTTANFFPMLGVRPIIGRSFTSEDQQHNSPAFSAPVCVLSYATWQRRFGGDPAIVGRAITLSGQTSTIVGVLPAEFEFRLAYDVWVPLPTSAGMGLEGRHVPVLTVFGRLRHGVGVAQARLEMAAIAARLAADEPLYDRDRGILVTPLRDFYLVRTGTREILLLVFGVAGLVLVICCANLANLMLVRNSARQRELAVRLALGASRSRLAASLLIESLLLSIAGGVVGLALAAWGLPVARGLLPVMPTFRSDSMTLDAHVLVFASLASMSTIVLFGLLPAVSVARSNVHRSLKDGGRTSSDRRDQSLRALLVILEFGISVAVVVSASLAIRTLRNLERVEPGIDTERLLMVGLYLPSPRYGSERDITQFYHHLRDRLEQVPGVEAMAMTLGGPLDPVVLRTSVGADGRPPEPANADPQAVITTATPDYFRTLGVALRSGRVFDARDMEPDAPPVVLVSQALAWIVWPHDDPLGRRLRIGNDAGARLAVVVGVVGDVHHESLAGGPDLEVYEPVYRGAYWDPRTLIVRTATRPDTLTSQVIQAIASLDPDQPQNQVSTMERVVETSLLRQRFLAEAIGLFGGLALTLAALGIYGVMSHFVSQRAHEMAIRLALGGSPRGIRGMVLRRGLTLAGPGLVLGLAGAAAVGRVMSNTLYGVTAFDRLSFVGAPALLTAIALVASYVPACRMTRIDPMRVLRDE